ncbi:OsmC family protein [Kangiella shandongensis]|uniref:OsmC family protein n=1 Tax=Kangiella shandongensis TaxID=2763258 RepID=UPI001CC08C8A|nr:OsmC family protein [Kangiella shandongensis]
MAQYFATINWSRGDQKFFDNQYSRAHQWSFDGGAVVEASSSPHIVPLPHSVESNVDPEEAFVASLSSCHMLFFLSIAAKKRLVVDSYEDEAVGVMGKDEQGKEFVETVTLKPKAVFSGEKQPSAEVLEKMHHQAHELCFIANSVKTKVLTEVRS